LTQKNAKDVQIAHKLTELQKKNGPKGVRMNVQHTTENKLLTDHDVIEVISKRISPKVDCCTRFDLPGGPVRQIYVEFCGWSTAMLVHENKTMGEICAFIKTSFDRACHPPGFFKRIWLGIKKWLYL
jgi:hypothetical protein